MGSHIFGFGGKNIMVSREFVSYKILDDLR